jgi:hypothetical protein
VVREVHLDALAPNFDDVPLGAERELGAAHRGLDPVLSESAAAAIWSASL